MRLSILGLILLAACEAAPLPPGPAWPVQDAGADVQSCGPSSCPFPKTQPNVEVVDPEEKKLQEWLLWFIIMNSFF